jgi:dolichol-phosphate mannosyltransferase
MGIDNANLMREVRGMYKSKRVLLLTTVLNEQGKIGQTIKKVPWDIVDEFLVIDDGSTDGTAKEACKAGAHIISNGRNFGVGYSIRRGMKYAIENKYDFVVHIAGDNQDDAREIPKLLEPLSNGYDIVQGSRYLMGIKNIPFFRKLTTKTFTLAIRLVTGCEITDGSNGFRAYKIKIAKNIDYSKKWLNRYELEPYMLIKAIRNGYRYTEVPVKKSYPKEGYSKMKPFSGWYSMVKPLIYSFFD